MSKVRRSVFAACPLVCLLLTAGASWASGTVALVVGNESYASDRPLGALVDAERLAGHLTSLGVRVRSAGDVRAHQWSALLTGFERDANAATLAIVVFAGHALQLGDTAYVVPAGTNLRTRSDLQRLIPVQELIDAMRGAERGLLVLDTCYASSLAAGWGDGVFARQAVCADRDALLHDPAAHLSVLFGGREPVAASARGGGVLAGLTARLRGPRDDVVERIDALIADDDGGRGAPDAVVVHGEANVTGFALVHAEPVAPAVEPTPIAQAPVPGDGRTEPEGPEGSEPFVITGRRGSGVTSESESESESPSDPAPEPASEPASGPASESVQEPVREQDATPARRARLTVRTRPADARVRILNIAPRYRAGMELPIDRAYRVEVTHPGMVPVRWWVQLGEQDEVVEIALSPAPAPAPAPSPAFALETATVASLRDEPSDEVDGPGRSGGSEATSTEPEPARTRQERKAEQGVALARFQRLERAIESGDRAMLMELVVDGPKRDLFLGLVDNYATIDVEMQRLRRSRDDETRYEMDLVIRDMTTEDGLRVTPAETFRTTAVSNRKLDTSGTRWTSVY